MTDRERLPRNRKRRNVLWRSLFRRGSYFAECGKCGDLGPVCKCNGLRRERASVVRFIVGAKADRREASE